MDAKSVRNVWSNIAVTNKHTAKLHHIGSFYIYMNTLIDNISVGLYVTYILHNYWCSVLNCVLNQQSCVNNFSALDSMPKMLFQFTQYD